MPQSSFDSETDAGSWMNELQAGIQGSMGALPTTQAGWSDYFAADPLTKSIMMDYEQEFAKKQAQSMEDMKRLGVIRAGDTQRALSNLQESDARTRAGIQSDSAARAQANYEKARAAGIDLSSVMGGHEVAAGELTGMYGGTPTLSGRQYALDLVAAALAAKEAGGGATSPPISVTHTGPLCAGRPSNSAHAQTNYTRRQTTSTGGQISSITAYGKQQPE